MKRISLALLSVLLLVSCSTVEYVQTPLPDFEPSIPTRPTLEKVEGSVPTAVNVNTIRLMDYCRELESYGRAWREFYEQLKGL